MRWPGKIEKHVNGRGWFHMSGYGMRFVVRLRMAAYAENRIAPGSDSCGKRYKIGWRKLGNPWILRHIWVFPLTQTRKESANAWVNECMESDHSHTAYRIRMPQPHAAYAYRVYGILALRFPLNNCLQHERPMHGRFWRGDAIVI